MNPNAIFAMEAIGIDISKSLDEFIGWNFDIVATVCSDSAGTCPFFPGKEHIHRNFEDPSWKSGSDEENLVEFRRIGDEIWNWMKERF